MVRPVPKESTIVVFGAAVRPDGKASGVLARRVDTARAAAPIHPNVRFLVTGARGRYGPPEARVMAALLEAHGVPTGRITLEETGHDTLSSALACARILEESGASRGEVWVCTSGFHLLRCRLLFRCLGIRSRGLASRDRRHLPWTRHAYFVIREIPATVWDTLLVTWHRLRAGGI